MTFADVANEIYSAAAKFGVDPALVFAVAQNESGFRQSAVSSVGALGVMQVMPDVEGGTTRTVNGVVYDLTDLSENVAAGVAYLAGLQAKYGGDTTKAVAAYNAGPGNVDKYGGVPPFAETRAYVSNVLASFQKFANALPSSSGAANQQFYVGDQVPGSDQWVITGQAPEWIWNPFDPRFWSQAVPGALTGTLGQAPSVIIPIENAPRSNTYKPGMGWGDLATPAGQKKPQVNEGQKQIGGPGWQAFVTDLVHGIETNLLLAGIAIALLIGGFMLVASDHPEVVKKVGEAAAA